MNILILLSIGALFTVFARAPAKNSQDDLARRQNLVGADAVFAPSEGKGFFQSVSSSKKVRVVVPIKFSFGYLVEADARPRLRDAEGNVCWLSFEGEGDALSPTGAGYRLEWTNVTVKSLWDRGFSPALRSGPLSPKADCDELAAKTRAAYANRMGSASKWSFEIPVYFPSEGRMEIQHPNCFSFAWCDANWGAPLGMSLVSGTSSFPFED